MKFVVIGGTGLIGSQVCDNLRTLGHEAFAAAPSTGVDTITGEGLDDALKGVDVVVDVANSPSFADADVLAFFETSGRNLFAAEARTGVRHHVALSVVGSDRLPDNGYLRAKLAQEKLIGESGIPYSILRATQFFEFLGAIAATGTQDGTVRLTSASLQPIASTDVAAALTAVATSAPTHRITEVAGPERRPMVEFVRDYLQYHHDPRKVVADDTVPYFGAVIDDASLTPGADATIGGTSFETWLARSLPPR